MIYLHIDLNLVSKAYKLCGSREYKSLNIKEAVRTHNSPMRGANDENEELKEDKRTTKHERTRKNRISSYNNLSVSRRKTLNERTTRQAQRKSNQQTRNDESEWRSITITPECRELVKKICYEMWGLDENGNRK